LKAQVDPQLWITLPQDAAADCRTLQVSIDEDIERPDTATAFFLRLGETEFGSASDAVSRQTGQDRTNLFFRSESGFAPLIRIDPGEVAQTSLIKELVIGCVAGKAD